MKRRLSVFLAGVAAVVIGLAGVQSVSARSYDLATVTIKSVVDNPTTVITPPTPPDNSGSPSQTISGTTKPNTKVTIFDNGEAVASGQSDANGNFSIETPLQEGQNQISAQAPKGQPSNQVTINRQSEPSWWHRYGWWLVGGFCLLIIVAGGWWMLAAKRRKQNDDSASGGDSEVRGGPQVY